MKTVGSESHSNEKVIKLAIIRRDLKREIVKEAEHLTPVQKRMLRGILTPLSIGELGVIKALTAKK